MTRRPGDEEGGVLPRAALLGGGFTLLAVLLELWGSWGTGATAAPPASWLVPTGWPTAIRVTWWLAAAAGAVVTNRGLARVTGRPRRVATVLAATPFVTFAVGIALGAEWATWH